MSSQPSSEIYNKTNPRRVICPHWYNTLQGQMETEETSP